MKSKIEDKALSIYLEGRIDSSNSSQIAADIDEELKRFEFDKLILNAKDLDYLSSAGLRVILKLKKSFDNVKLIKANQTVYEILDMTGFTEMMEVERMYRTISVDDCQIIGIGAKGTVYRYDKETVVKVYNNPESLKEIQKERMLAKEAFILGIPTAISYDIARVDGKFGSVFELLDAKSFSQLIAEDPNNIDFYVSEYAKLLKKINCTVIKPDSMPDYKKTAFIWIDTAKEVLPRETYDKIYNMIKSAPDKGTMLHCDYHTNNLMFVNGETLIIDMDTISHGNPIFDLANIYVAHVGFGELSQEFVSNYLGYPYDVSVTVWKKFLPQYLETTDENRIKEVENKTKLLAYVRILRHMIRRNEHSTEEGKKKLIYFMDKITELADKIDSFDF